MALKQQLMRASPFLSNLVRSLCWRDISQTLGDGVRVLASLRKGHDEHGTLLTALGGLYEAGYAVDWSKQYASGKTGFAAIVSLPTATLLAA